MANGLYSNEELIDTLIMDCNNAVNAVMGSNGIQWCKIMLDMVVKLTNLKNGIANDIKTREDTITLLTQRLKDAGMEVQTIDINELGADQNGCN